MSGIGIGGRDMLASICIGLGFKLVDGGCRTNEYMLAWFVLVGVVWLGLVELPMVARSTGEIRRIESIPVDEEFEWEANSVTRSVGGMRSSTKSRC